MSDQLKELSEKIDGYAKAVITAQDSAEKAVKSTDSLIKVVEEKAAKEAAKTAEEIQELKLKIDSADKTAEYLEKMVSRMGNGSGSDSANSEMETKAAEQTARYLRTGLAMDNDVAEAVIVSMCNKAFYGVPEYRRESEIKTLIAGVNPQGGYFIRPERSARYRRT